MNLHAQVLEKNGKKEFVVLPYNEFLKIEESLEDFEDLRELRKAKSSSKHQSSIPLSQVKKELNLK